MRAHAYLMPRGSVTVLPAGETPPEGFITSESIDTGPIEDWRFTVQLGEARIRQGYRIVSGRAIPVEKHTCGRQTIRYGPIKRRYDLDGQSHSCSGKREYDVDPDALVISELFE